MKRFVTFRIEKRGGQLPEWSLLTSNSNRRYPRKMRILAFILTSIFLAVPSGRAQNEQDIPILRAHVEVVNILATVRDKRDRYIPDMTREDFVILEDGVHQKIEFFNYETGADAQPLTIVLAIDTSGSVKRKLGFEQQAASEFLTQVLQENRDMAAILQFDNDITLAQDFSFDFDILKRAIFDIRAGGATKLYDAIYLASEDLLAQEVGRRVIVVLSDGEDTHSRLTALEGIRAAQEQDIVIFGIGVRSPGGNADFDTLRRFAQSTGGVFYKSKNDLARLRDVFNKINQEIRNQVSLGFISTNPKRDGGFRRIEVRVQRAGLQVTHRKGYYAAEPGQ